MFERIVDRTDHLTVARLAAGDVLGEGAPGDGQAIAVETASGGELAEHRRHAPGAVEALAEIGASGLHVEQQRDVVAVRGPVARGQLDPGVPRHRHDVRLRVGRPADRRDEADRVEEALAAQDRRGAQVFIGHVDDAQAGFIGHLPALAIGRRDRRAAGQRQAERLGHRIHRRGGAHRVAMAGRWCAVGGAIQELLLVDLAGRELAARTPDDGARADQLAFVPAV